MKFVDISMPIIHNGVFDLLEQRVNTLYIDHAELSTFDLLMLLEQIHYTADGEALWYSRTFYRSDVIGFHIVRT